MKESPAIQKAAISASFVITSLLGCTFIAGYWANAGAFSVPVGRLIAFIVVMAAIHGLAYIHLAQQIQPDRDTVSPGMLLFGANTLATECEAKSVETCAAAIKVAVVQHALFLILTALLLDGGLAFYNCRVFVLAHWVIIAVILCRRFRYPTHIDVYIIKYGFIPLILAIGLVASAIHRWVGA